MANLVVEVDLPPSNYASGAQRVHPSMRAALVVALGERGVCCAPACAASACAADDVGPCGPIHVMEHHMVLCAGHGARVCLRGACRSCGVRVCAAHASSLDAGVCSVCGTAFCANCLVENWARNAYVADRLRCQACTSDDA